MSWSCILSKSKKIAYVRTFVNDDNGKRHDIFLHRLLMSAPLGTIVDHADHDGLNNCGSTNLRFATQSQSSANSTRVNVSGYRGVVVDKRGKQIRYSAYLKCQNDTKCLGTYDSLEEAAVAHDDAARRFHGEYAILNFPDIDRTPEGRRRRSSEYVGVSFSSRTQKWKARIRVGTTRHHIGWYGTEALAAAAVKQFLDTGIKLPTGAKPKTSRYNGVSWDKRAGKWLAYNYDPSTRRTRNLGLYSTEEEAAAVVAKARAEINTRNTTSCLKLVAPTTYPERTYQIIHDE